jgi:hypothetical protein
MLSRELGRPIDQPFPSSPRSGSGPSGKDRIR